MTKVRKDAELNYPSYQSEYGMMFHLLLDLKDMTPDKIRFCSFHDKGKYLAVNGKPVFFTSEFGFRVAESYTIIYPKVYVKSSSPLVFKHGMQRAYIH